MMCPAAAASPSCTSGARGFAPRRLRVSRLRCRCREAPLPLLLCVKLGLTGEGPGSFEANLASLNLREGVDYLHFS